VSAKVDRIWIRAGRKFIPPGDLVSTRLLHRLSLSDRSQSDRCESVVCEDIKAAKNSASSEVYISQ